MSGMLLQSMEATMQDGGSRSAQAQLMQSLRQLLQGLGKGSPDAPAAATSWATLCFLRIMPPACMQLQSILEGSSKSNPATADQAANADLQARCHPAEAYKCIQQSSAVISRFLMV